LRGAAVDVDQGTGDTTADLVRSSVAIAATSSTELSRFDHRFLRLVIE
jgi:hypothetical protein